MFFFHILPLFCLLGSAISLPIDLAPNVVPAEAYFPKLVTTLSRLENALKTIPPGGSLEEAAGRTNDLVRTQAEYSNTLRDAARDVRRGQNMVPTDGMRMISSIQQVGKLLQSTSTGWVHAKEMVVAAGKRNDVYQELINASDATSIFGDAFVAKMPPAVQSRGKSFSKDCTSYLEAAIKAYKN
jgi:hypothetical protein